MTFKIIAKDTNQKRTKERLLNLINFAIWDAEIQLTEVQRHKLYRALLDHAEAEGYIVVQDWVRK